MLTAFLQWRSVVHHEPAMAGMSVAEKPQTQSRDTSRRAEMTHKATLPVRCIGNRAGSIAQSQSQGEQHES
ncbi:hypothetical protein AERO9A_140276 [Aeromonas salmonicida]|nr:hypothetical protein AERO9A_140276 [Aeromonas salmonicida]